MEVRRGHHPHAWRPRTTGGGLRGALSLDLLDKVIARIDDEDGVAERQVFCCGGVTPSEHGAQVALLSSRSSSPSAERTSEIARTDASRGSRLLVRMSDPRH